MCLTLSGRKILFSVFVLLSVLFIYSACRKQDREEAIVERDLITRAKTWYSEQIVAEERKVLNEPYSVLSKTDDKRVFARMGKLQKLLRWSDAKTFKDGDLEYLIVPMSNLKEWQTQQYKGQRAMIFFKKSNDELSMQITEVLSLKSEMVPPNVVDVAHAWVSNSRGKSSAIVSASEVHIVFYDKNYTQLSSARYRNGKWVEGKLELRNVKGTPNRERAVSTITTLSSCNCTDYYLIGYFYDLATGQIISAHILASYSICEGGYSYPPYGGSPGDGGSSACADVDYQLSALVSSGYADNKVISRDEEHIDPVTRTRLYEWILRKGGGYEIVANLKGTHTKVPYTTDFTLQWAWKNLEYLNIFRRGLVVVGTVEPSSDFFQWHYSSFISRGYLRYKVNYTVTCMGRPVSNIVSYDGWGEFSAN